MKNREAKQLKLFIVQMLFMAFSITAYANITGTVYRDFNANGTQDSVEPGVENITVSAYDSAGANQGTVNTLADGTYDLLVGGSGPYRLEFTGLPSYLKPGIAKTSSSSSVQFVATDTATNMNFSVNNPSQYNTGAVNTSFAVSTQRSGASVNQTNATSNYAFISLPYTATGNADGSGDLNNPDPSKDVAFSKVGTVWGAAYQRKSGYLFSAAFLKRHQGLGELARPALNSGEHAVPVDGIYMIDYDASVGGAYVGGFTLNGVTPSAGNAGVIDLGTVTRETISSAVNSAHPNALTTNSNSRSYDIDAFAKVGKVGFGDLDIQENDNILWVVNLKQKSLIRIDGSDAAS